VRSGAPDRQLFPDGGLGRQNGWITDVDHPVVGRHPRLMPLVEFSRSSTVVLPSALCGAHTDGVLSGIGYDADRIAALREARVIL
jgi:formyl-CoA transferase